MYFSKYILIITSLILFTACRSDQSSLDARSQPAPTVQPSVSPKPAQPEATVAPNIKAKVPESLKRPLTAEEMQKAFQQVPSSARAQIQGKAIAPPQVRKGQLSKPTPNPAVKK